MSNQKSNVNINPMPIGKLTSLVNVFLMTTTNHLNKLSVSSEEKLNEFDKKLRRLDNMVTLLETKLNSLPPEITNNYPPLVHQTINDVNPFFISKPDNSVNLPVNSVTEKPIENVVPVTQNTYQNPQENQEEQPEEKKPDDDSPETQLRILLEENPNLDKFHKMLKYGIPTIAIEQKAKFEGTEGDLISKLCELYKKVNPNPVY